MPPMDIDDLTTAYTAREVAPLLRITERHVRRMLNAGELEYIQVGRQKYVPKRALIDYVNRHHMKVPAALRKRR